MNPFEAILAAKLFDHNQNKHYALEDVLDEEAGQKATRSTVSLANRLMCSVFVVQYVVADLFSR